jgi:Translation initiation factor 2B subunit, eIF-2B alpha/beta/delta family
MGLSGKVAHTLGHLAIADMAAAYKIPIYIIADSLKIHHIIDELDRIPQRKEPWITTDIEFEDIVKKCKIFNPRGDVVPADKITAIVTEKGIIDPKFIKSHYEKIL